MRGGQRMEGGEDGRWDERGGQRMEGERMGGGMREEGKGEDGRRMTLVPSLVRGWGRD